MLNPNQIPISFIIDIKNFDLIYQLLLFNVLRALIALQLRGQIRLGSFMDNINGAYMTKARTLEAKKGSQKMKNNIFKTRARAHKKNITRAICFKRGRPTALRRTGCKLILLIQLNINNLLYTRMRCSFGHQRAALQWRRPLATKEPLFGGQRSSAPLRRWRR